MQIARTRRGVQTILEHLGSAHDDAQLAALVAIARERIAEMNGQEQLDLDALAPASPPRSSGPVVTGSRSRVLWEVLEDAYARLGFDAVGNDTFKKLVLARVVEPTSKALRILGGGEGVKSAGDQEHADSSMCVKSALRHGSVDDRSVGRGSA